MEQISFEVHPVDCYSIRKGDLITILIEISFVCPKIMEDTYFTRLSSQKN